MSAVHPPSHPLAADSDTSVSKPSLLNDELQAERIFETLNEGMPIPSAFIRTEVARMLQREQEKAVALLETSPLLSYLFFTYVISAKETSDPSISDHSEELSALKLRSEKLESELAAAQAALTEAHDLVETLREEVQQLRIDTLEDRSRDAAVLKEREKEKENLRKEAQTYKVRRDQGTCLDVRDLTSICLSLTLMPHGRVWPTSSLRLLARTNSISLTRLDYKPGSMNFR